MLPAERPALIGSHQFDIDPQTYQLIGGEKFIEALKDTPDRVKVLRIEGLSASGKTTLMHLLIKNQHLQEVAGGKDNLHLVKTDWALKSRSFRYNLQAQRDWRARDVRNYYHLDKLIQITDFLLNSTASQPLTVSCYERGEVAEYIDRTFEQPLPAGAILIIEGIFAFSPEIDSVLDQYGLIHPINLLVDSEPQVAIERAIRRAPYRARDPEDVRQELHEYIVPYWVSRLWQISDKVNWRGEMVGQGFILEELAA